MSSITTLEQTGGTATARGCDYIEVRSGTETRRFRVVDNSVGDGKGAFDAPATRLFVSVWSVGVGWTPVTPEGLAIGDEVHDAEHAAAVAFHILTGRIA